MASDGLDTSFAELTTELERIAIIDVVAKLIKDEIPVEVPGDFWSQASMALAVQGFNRTAAEAEYLFEFCRKEGRAVANAKRYIDNKKRQGARQGKAASEYLVYPKAAPDPMAVPAGASKEPGEGDISAHAAEQLRGTAAAALALIAEREREQKAEDKKNPKWNMSSR